MRTAAPRLGVQQRVLPSYRVPFFDSLAQVFPQGVSVFAGQPRRGRDDRLREAARDR